MSIRRYELPWRHAYAAYAGLALSLLPISEPTRPEPTSYAVFCLTKNMQ